MNPTDPSLLPARSPLWIRWFTRYTRKYLRKNFHAIHTSALPDFSALAGQPLLVYLNHASWWDPLTSLVLAMEFLADREHYAAMDAGMLRKFRFFARLGFFGLEPGTPTGAKTLLKVSDEILHGDNSALWLTPQGRFADVRERPPQLAGGLARVAARMSKGVVLPVAVEYVFWNDRQPEILTRFGRPVFVKSREPHAIWQERLTAELAQVQDELAGLAQAREAAAFSQVLSNPQGMTGVYGFWQRFRERFGRASADSTLTESPKPPTMTSSRDSVTDPTPQITTLAEEP